MTTRTRAAAVMEPKVEGRTARDTAPRRAASATPQGSTANSTPSLFGDEALPAAPAPWEVAADSDLLAAQVVLNKPLASAYTYLVPDELRELVAPGHRVRVPFGRGDKPEVGYVVAVAPPEPTSKKLKHVAAVLDREPLVSPKMLALTQ